MSRVLAPVALIAVAASMLGMKIERFSDPTRSSAEVSEATADMVRSVAAVKVYCEDELADGRLARMTEIIIKAGRGDDFPRAEEDLRRATRGDAKNPEDCGYALRYATEAVEHLTALKDAGK